MTTPRTTLRRRGLLLGSAALVLPLALPSLAHAQAFPSKPITLIVPWPAGGSTDRHLRTLAEIASKNLGQMITVENRPGGGGTTGPGTMALTAKPDGYTIAQYPMGMLRVPHMQKVQWDPLKDFTFIIGVRATPSASRFVATRRTRPSTSTSRQPARSPARSTMARPASAPRRTC
jgi:tripartite-type tricarboxylate transporter receptor subunit TctC